MSDTEHHRINSIAGKARRLANHSIPEAVTAGVTLAVHLHAQSDGEFADLRTERRSM